MNSQTTRTNTKASILIIDDEMSILNALQMFLEQEGYDVTVATGYEQYSEITDEHTNPDVAILDIMLGAEDGREVATRLKDDPGTADLPIIMISAHPDVRRMAEVAGADAYLAKPFDIDHLLAAIDAQLRQTT